MAVGRAFRRSAQFDSGNGVEIADGGTGPLNIKPNILSTELTDTGVTPGSYTSSDLTVDAKGRITAIANGSGGSSSAPNTTTLTAGVAPNDLSVEVEWWGTGTPTLGVNAQGDYVLTFLTNQIAKAAHFTLDDNNFSSQILILRIVDTDGRSLYFNPALVALPNGTYQPLAGAGINPSQDPTTAGTIISTWSNMSYASGCVVILNF